MLTRMKYLIALQDIVLPVILFLPVFIFNHLLVMMLIDIKAVTEVSRNYWSCFSWTISRCKRLKRHKRYLTAHILVK
jgi:hypothetical protein